MDLLTSTISQMRDGIEKERDTLKKPSPIKISNLKRNGLQYICASTKKITGDTVCSIKGKEYPVDIVISSGVMYISGLEDLGADEIQEAYLYQDESSLTQKILDEFTVLKTNNLHKDLFQGEALKEGEAEFDNKDLNKSQAIAVAKALTNNSLLVVGPAGTGKTKTIVATIKAMVDKGLRVLVCSHANLAVEGAMESLVQIHGDEFDRDELVCEIKTKSKLLKDFSVGKLSKEQISFLEDEMDELEEITKNLLSSKHQKEDELKPIKGIVRSSNAMLSNLENEEKKATINLLTLEKQRQSLQERVNKLSNNKLLALFAQSSKKESLTLKLEEVINEVANKEKEVKELNQRLFDYKEKLSNIKIEYKKINEELEEIEKNLATVSSRKKEIRNEIEDLLSENYYKNAKVGAVTLMKAAINKKIRDAGFDVLIVDEVSMATVPVLMLAMEAISKKVILFGDPMQLPPIAQSNELKNSIFDVLEITDSFLAGHIHPKCVFLDTQFRCHPEIAKLTSSLFYGGILKNGRVVEDDKKAMYIKNSHGMGARFIYQNSEGGYVNVVHQQIVLAQVENALKRGQQSIGVVCPFRAQANAINELYNYKLAHKYPDADFLCSTIHSFQGQEKNVVIFDFMFGYNPGNQNIPKMLVGDITSSTAKLLNVATTRARDFFVLVCDLQYVKSVFKNTEDSERLAIFQWLQAIEQLAFNKENNEHDCNKLPHAA